jgi:ribonucleoside-diphosphate reductase beta chain
MKKQVYNLKSDERFEMAKVIGGNPNGIINFEKTPHKWAKNIFDTMLKNTWFATEPDISQDKLNYDKLTYEEKRSYDLVLSQLISNDSIQTNQLMDSINQYITSPVVNACIARQTFEEANHSLSYAVMVEDICKDTDRIYRMFEHDEKLRDKNNKVADMFKNINANNPTVEDLYLAFTANQILEEMIFPIGFAVMYHLGKKMKGSAKMIYFIHRDELTHTALFKNIYQTAVRENSIKPNESKILEMIRYMADIEKEWGYYATEGLTGFSKTAIDLLVEYQANSVCTNLKLSETAYEVTDGGPLVKLLKDNIPTANKTKTNFFEGQVADYSIGSLDMSDF